MDKARAGLTIGALGIVFGDIGTSPLYALREAAHAADHLHPEAAILGVLSLMTWAIVIAIAIKYIGLVLRVDNEGEGGILALATLLGLHRKEGGRPILLGVALLGAAMLFGDGVITPAISVLSAIEGLELAAPHLHRWVVPITVVVLIVLFAAQRAGTHRIGGLFGPVMLTWFAALGALGLMSVITNPGIFVALSPQYGLALLAHAPMQGLVVLSAVFLAITGGEALYADLGHFGRRAIARAWFLIAMPGLLLNYFGQGALVLADPAAIESPFYLLSPQELRLPLIVLATAATIIASQAVITGVMSLARQAMEIGLLVPLRTIHTAAENESHVFVGTINTLLAVMAVTVVIGFGSSSALASAYGVAVAAAMITTTVLYAAVITRSDKWSKPLAWSAAVALLTFDAVFLAANLGKIPDGGWFPLSLAAFALTVMIAWRLGRRRSKASIAHASFDLAKFAFKEEREPSNLSRTAVFLTRDRDRTPSPLLFLDRLFGATFKRAIVVSVTVIGRPRVSMEEGAQVKALSGGVLKITLSVGYMQVVNLPSLIGPVLKAEGIDSDEVVYVVSLDRPVAPSHVRSIGDLLAVIYVILARNAERTADRFSLPPRRTLEIGVPIRL